MSTEKQSTTDKTTHTHTVETTNSVWGWVKSHRIAIAATVGAVATAVGAVYVMTRHPEAVAEAITDAADTVADTVD